MDRALLGGAAAQGPVIINALLYITVTQSCTIYFYQSTLNNKITYELMAIKKTKFII